MDGGGDRHHGVAGVGEEMILEDNAFLEQALPGTVVSSIAEGDLHVYRKPYPTPESRRPLLRWARSMPLGGEPADVVARVEAYDDWLADSSRVPKLLLAFAPGPDAMMTPGMLDWCAANIAGLEIRRYAEAAGHHSPEDRPELIAAVIAAWADEHRLR